jgi:hypothetical protein
LEIDKIMITDIQIEQAIRNIRKDADAYHEHNDCVRIAYQWLDAQVKIKNPCSRFYPVKHLIEKWAGRYVSTSDVKIAAYLHPDITGNYPTFNISSRLTEPSLSRLEGLAQAFTQPNYREGHNPKIYKNNEDTKSA